MSARDELAAIYVETLNRGHGVIERPEQGLKAADAILAAGYRKPRTIADVEELDVLGTNAAVLAANGAVWVNDGDCTEPWACVTEDPQGGPVWADDDGIQLPAIVLHEP